jgi:uncharacterized Tic20 family protein
MADMNMEPGPSSEFEPEQDPADVKTERSLAMICHLLGLCLFLSIPLANIAGPLVLWLIKKDDYPFVDDQGKEAVNFQITVILAIFACVPLIPLFFIGIPLILAVVIADVIFIIKAAMEASEGEVYRYPYCLRLVN